MPHRSLAQRSFFDVCFAAPGCLQEGTLEWWLAEHREDLLPPWLFEGWRGEGRRGRKAWPAFVLMSLLLLRGEYGPMSRCESARRAQRDITWRAAMGLPIGGPSPSERTLRRFETFLSTRHPQVGERRYLLLHEHWVRRCLADKWVDAGRNWATDSTPMWAFGAASDTVRLLGDGLRALMRRWARWMKISLEQCAKQWDVPVVLAKSTKGAFHIDWKDADERQRVINELTHGALRVVSAIRQRIEEVPRASYRKKLLQRCRQLAKVIADDLMQDEHGRWSIAQGTTPDRMVSITDPDARHSRKSKAVCFKGFKLHLIGEIDSGVIAAVGVTAANVHDGRVAPRLVRRAKSLCDELTRLMGDTAYGAASLRRHLSVLHGVDVLAPPPPATTPAKTFRKEEFAIDFEREVATCPAGISSSDVMQSWSSDYGASFQVFKWSKESCGACPLSSRCRGASTQPRRLALHPYEAELRNAQAQWADPQVRQAYRLRSQTERLVREMTRRGGRQAPAWGLQSAHLHAHLIAMANNLALLSRAQAGCRPPAIEAA
jgi:hypothetical protein